MEWKCNAMQCNAMQCNAMQCNANANAMQCNAMQCNATQRNAMQCNAMQCNAMRYNAMRYNSKGDRCPDYGHLSHFLLLAYIRAMQSHLRHVRYAIMIAEECLHTFTVWGPRVGIILSILCYVDFWLHFLGCRSLRASHCLGLSCRTPQPRGSSPSVL